MVFITSLVKFSVILLTLLVVSFTRLYSSITFNLVLVNRTLFGSFVFFLFVTVDTSCVCQSGYEIVEEGLLNLKHLIKIGRASCRERV